MKLCICGSRSFEGVPADKVWSLAMEGFRRFCQENDLPFDATVQGLTVLHGGAKGVDTLAGIAASMRGLEVQAFAAEWGKFGKYAGHMRNIQMVAEADVVVAIWDGVSTGTADAMKFCKTVGKPLYVVRPA